MDPKKPKDAEDLRRKRKGARSEEGDDPCGFCANFRSRGEKGEACGSSINFMTEREFKALKAMREIKNEVKEVKERMEQIEADFGIHTGSGKEDDPSHSQNEGASWEEGIVNDLLENCEKLYSLKKSWEEWDEERMAAAEERMRLLGHIQ